MTLQMNSATLQDVNDYAARKVRILRFSQRSKSNERSPTQSSASPHAALKVKVSPAIIQRVKRNAVQTERKRESKLSTNSVDPRLDAVQIDPTAWHRLMIRTALLHLEHHRFPAPTDPKLGHGKPTQPLPTLPAFVRSKIALIGAKREEMFAEQESLS